MMKKIATFFALSITFSGCKTTDEAAQSELRDASTGSVFAGLAGKMNTLNQAQKDRVIASLRQVKKEFYETTNGYEKTPSGSSNPPSSSEIATCLGVVPGRWSDITSHYYCTYPGYSGGYHPNIRECFTYLVMPTINATIDGVKPNYNQAYDYCVYMPINRKNFVEGAEFVGLQIQSFPKFDDTNKSNNKLIGPLAWVQTNQPDSFDFIMKMGHCGVDPRQQQEILNEYYGVDLKGKVDYTSADTDQVTECKNKRPLLMSNGARASDLSDSSDGTHCSYDMRKKKPGPAENCY